MWSKTRQILEGRMAESLKGRVRYQYDVYRTNKCKEKPSWRTEAHVFSVIVDGKPWLCTNPLFYYEKYDRTRPERSDEDIIRETGHVPNGWGAYVPVLVHQYLNVLSIDEAIAHGNYFIRLLAVLDARLGKRRIKELAGNIENEPEWFRKWILLRAGATSNRQTQITDR